MRSFMKMTAVLFLCATAPVAFSSADKQTMQLQDIREQQTRLQGEIRAGRGAFKEMSEAERGALLSKQERLLLLLQNKQDFDELAVDAKLEVFNTLEQIRSTVAQAEEDRMVCRKDRVMGSHLPQVVCMTAKEERLRRERTRDAIRRGQGCTSSECVIVGPNP
jgi:hypothetical protein